MVADTSKDTKSNIDYTERAYSTSEVAKMIGAAIPTIRKYSQSLESKGYEFIRSKEKGRQRARLYTHNDIMALRYLKETREQANITVEEATNIVVEKFGKGINETIQPIMGNDIESESSYLKEYDNRYDELKKMINKQNEIIHNLTEKLDQRDEELKKRDNIIINTLNEIAEQPKQIEAPKEAVLKEKKKKSLFSKLIDKILNDDKK